MNSVSDKVRCAVIGAGYWGTFAHIPAIIGHPNASLEAIQNRDPAKAEKVARDFNVPRGFTDANELLDETELDAVIVSSTPNMHYEHAGAAIERGLHVLIEKPMALRVKEARELCELADRKGVGLVLSSPWHYTPHSVEARRLIREGEIGEIKMISILMTNPVHDLLKGINTKPTHDDSDTYLEPEPGSYDDPDIAGGGQIFCQVTHPAAYLPFLTGARPKEVFSHMDYYSMFRDLYDVLAIKMDDDTLVSLASTGATPLEERNYEVRVYGTRGVLFLELWKGTFSRIDFGNRWVHYPDLKSDELYPEQAPAINLIDYVLGRSPNESPGTLGLAAIEIAEAARKSSHTGENEILR